jgi:hypothetical protein
MSKPGVTPLKMTVHPGVGDLSWLLSKFLNCGRPLHLTVCEDATRRSKPFLDLFPSIVSGYGTGQLAYERLRLCWNGTYAEVLDAESKGFDIYLSCNNWLDSGNRLEEWFPDLPADFHYDIPLPPEAIATSGELLPPGAMYIGIHTASLGGMRAWDGWGPGEWMDFIREVHADYPYVVFVLLGARWDSDMKEQLAPMLERFGVPVVDIVGQTALPVSLAVIRRCRYMVGFASGMSILANVMRVPVLMLYPAHLRELMNAWPSLESIATGSYAGMVWPRPKTAYRRVSMTIQRALG